MKYDITLSTDGACGSYGPPEGFATKKAALDFATRFLPLNVDFTIAKRVVVEPPQALIIDLAAYREARYGKRAI